MTSTKKNRLEAKKPKFKEPRAIPTLIRIADRVHSRYIRLKETKNGYGICVSCGKTFPFEKLDCGHFVGRDYMSTRYCNKNTHIQCIECNHFQEGNMKYKMLI